MLLPKLSNPKIDNEIAKTINDLINKLVKGTHDLNLNNLLLQTDIYNVPYTDYSSVSTVVGWSSFTEKNIWYKRVGRLVFVNFYIDGTSNSTSASFTLPIKAKLNCFGYTYFPQSYTVNNGTAEALGRGYIADGDNVVTLARHPAGAWTNANGKGICGNFWYEAEE